MPLHRGSFDLCKQVFSLTHGASPEAKAAFAALSPADQAKAMVDSFDTDPSYMTADFGIAEAACFVAVFRTQTGLTAAADLPKLRKDLGLQEPKGWAKPLAHINIMGIINSWPQEYAKIPEIAATLSYDALSAPIETVDAFIAASVRSILVMGGLEDVADPKSVGPADPIMKIFIEAVKFHLMTVTAPEWFSGSELNKALPADVSKASKYEQNKHVAAEKAKIRAEARRVAAAERRQRITDIKVTKRNGFFDAGIAAEKAIVELVTALKRATFAELKEITKADVWLTDDLQKVAKKFAVLIEVKADADEAVKEAAAAKAISFEQAIEFAQQYVLAELAVGNPDWFTKNAEADLVLRRGEPRAKGLDRKTRSIRIQVSKLIRKYGLDAVQVELKQFIANPDAVIISAEEEAEEEKAEAAAAKA